MAKQIKVAMIPDETRIIINAGLNEINEGDKIEIYIPGKEIKDPDTGDVIGQYDLVKSKLLITNVYDGYSIARKRIKETTPSIFEVASPMVSKKEYYIFKELPVLVSEKLKLNEEDSIIKVGDLVRIIN